MKDHEDHMDYVWNSSPKPVEKEFECEPRLVHQMIFHCKSSIRNSKKNVSNFEGTMRIPSRRVMSPAFVKEYIVFHKMRLHKK